MKQKLIVITIICAFSLGAAALLQAGGHGPSGFHHGGDPFEEITGSLNLTDDQKAKVQPVLDSAKPQMNAIHEEAMQKARVVMENTTAQIRPFLTAQQQQKLDTLKKAHEDMINAMRELHDAKK
jgi:Spy/CpxP family protein refolding chaperone